MQNLLALRERQKVESKLRDAIAQRKARRLAIDGKCPLQYHHHHHHDRRPSRPMHSCPLHCVMF